MLVATAHLSFSTARMAKIKLKLTVAGKKLLKLAKHLKLTATGTFTP